MRIFSDLDFYFIAGNKLWWDKLTKKQQEKYLEKHPKSKLKAKESDRQLKKFKTTLDRSKFDLNTENIMSLPKGHGWVGIYKDNLGHWQMDDDVHETEQDAIYNTAKKLKRLYHEPLQSEEHFNECKKRMDEVVAQTSYDPKLVELSTEKHWFELDGRKYPGIGIAQLNGKIRMYYDSTMPSFAYANGLAHEIQHEKYYIVRRAFLRETKDMNKGIQREYPLHEKFKKFREEFREELRNQDGVTPYSSDHWQALPTSKLFATRNDLAVNETLAEIACQKQNNENFQASPLWEEVFQMVNAEYENLKTDKSLRSHRKGKINNAPRLSSLSLKKIEDNARKKGVNLDLVGLDYPGQTSIGIAWIENQKGKPGAAIGVMSELCQFADAHGLEIFLDVLGGDKQLVNFYKFFGFELDPKDEADIMAGRYDWGGDLEYEQPPAMTRKPKKALKRIEPIPEIDNDDDIYELLKTIRKKNEDKPKSKEAQELEVRIKKLTEELGYDPDKISISMKQPKVFFNGMTGSTYGETDVENGIVKIYYYPDRSKEKTETTVVHEVMHCKYCTVAKAIAKEANHLREKINSGELTLETIPKGMYPLIDTFGKYRREDNIVKLVMTDGVTPYSHEHWRDWAINSSSIPMLFEGNTDLAINETIAEIASIKYAKEKFGKQHLKISPIWEQLYTDIIQAYDKLRKKK